MCSHRTSTDTQTAREPYPLLSTSNSTLDLYPLPNTQDYLTYIDATQAGFLQHLTETYCQFPVIAGLGSLAGLGWDKRLLGWATRLWLLG